MKKPLRVAIIGTGMYSGSHARVLSSREDLQLVALCATSEASPRRLIERRLADYRPRPAIFADLESMYAEVELDAVVIATPHHLHARHGLRAFEAGCHVFLEKPMAIDGEEAEALARRAEESDLVCALGFNTSSSAAFTFVREAIREQRFGALENFLDAIAGRSQPAAGLRDGLRHVRLMSALYRSARLGRPVKLGEGGPA